MGRRAFCWRSDAVGAEFGGQTVQHLFGFEWRPKNAKTAKSPREFCGLTQMAKGVDWLGWEWPTGVEANIVGIGPSVCCFTRERGSQLVGPCYGSVGNWHWRHPSIDDNVVLRSIEWLELTFTEMVISDFIGHCPPGCCISFFSSGKGRPLLSSHLT